MNLFAEYAEDLPCAHCGAKNRAKQWPERGDLEPFYNQKEPGQYSVTVHCPSCNKDWYVVWDDNPGAVRQLEPALIATASAQTVPDPAKADSLAKQGLECLRAGNAEEAITHLSTALQHDANHFGALQSLGLAHGMKGDHAQAATHLEAALRVNSNTAQTHFNLGVVYLKQGKKAEAIREMEAALQLKPDYPQAQQALAKLRTAAPPSSVSMPAVAQPRVTASGSSESSSEQHDYPQSFGGPPRVEFQQPHISPEIAEANSNIPEGFVGAGILMGQCACCGVIFPVVSAEDEANNRAQKGSWVSAMIGVMGYLNHHDRMKAFDLMEKEGWGFFLTHNLKGCERCNVLTCTICRERPHKEGRCAICSDVEIAEAGLASTPGEQTSSQQASLPQNSEERRFVQFTGGPPRVNFQQPQISPEIATANLRFLESFEGTETRLGQCAACGLIDYKDKEAACDGLFSYLRHCERCNVLTCVICREQPHREGRCVVCTDTEQLLQTKMKPVPAPVHITSSIVPDTDALCNAAGKGDIQVMEQQLNAGVGVNSKDRNGMTALHHAAGQNQVESAVFLISKGADLEAKSNGGFTPLAWALKWMGEAEIVRLLLDSGADVNGKATPGNTPLDLAIIRGGLPDVEQLLRDRSADRQGEDLMHKLGVKTESRGSQPAEPTAPPKIAPWGTKIRPPRGVLPVRLCIPSFRACEDDSGSGASC